MISLSITAAVTFIYSTVNYNCGETNIVFLKIHLSEYFSTTKGSETKIIFHGEIMSVWKAKCLLCLDASFFCLFDFFMFRCFPV